MSAGSVGWLTMATRNPVPALIAALVLAGLVAVDWRPELHGVPLLFFTMAAAVQVDRELAQVLARRRLYPPAPVMNFLSAILLAHVAYFRTPTGSVFLELVNTVLVAMLLLVVVSAWAADIKMNGWMSCLANSALGCLIPAVVAGGLSAALLLQVHPHGRIGADGSVTVAILLLAAWAGLAVGRLADHAVDGYPALTAGGLAARFVLPAVLGAAGLLAAGHALRALAPAVGLGLGTLLGYALVRWVANAADVDHFKADLPPQVDFLQPFYNRWFRGGLTDYAAALAPAFALAWLAARLVTP